MALLGRLFSRRADVSAGEDLPARAVGSIIRPLGSSQRISAPDNEATEAAQYLQGQRDAASGWEPCATDTPAYMRGYNDQQEPAAKAIS